MSRCWIGPHSRNIALSYLRLANLDNELIDRLSRYEGGLWRQTVHILFALQALKRRTLHNGAAAVLLSVSARGWLWFVPKRIPRPSK